MAEEIKEPEAVAKKKRGLLPILLVAVGAAIGGAGVVLLSPKPKPVEHAPPPPEIVAYEHPDVLEFTFNPQVKRGYKTALVQFKFVYEADRKLVEGDHAHGAAESGGGHGAAEPAAPAHLPPVLEAIKTYWNKASARCFEVLSGQDIDTLTTPDGMTYLKRLLIDELNATLFPEKQARVVDVYLLKIFVQ